MDHGHVVSAVLRDLVGRQTRCGFVSRKGVRVSAGGTCSVSLGVASDVAGWSELHVAVHRTLQFRTDHGVLDWRGKVLSSFVSPHSHSDRHRGRLMGDLVAAASQQECPSPVMEVVLKAIDIGLILLGVLAFFTRVGTSHYVPFQRS